MEQKKQQILATAKVAGLSKICQNYVYAMGTHNLHFLGLFHPYFEGVKASFFMVLGSKGVLDILLMQDNHQENH